MSINKLRSIKSLRELYPKLYYWCNIATDKEIWEARKSYRIDLSTALFLTSNGKMGDIIELCAEANLAKYPMEMKAVMGPKFYRWVDEFFRERLETYGVMFSESVVNRKASKSRRNWPNKYCIKQGIKNGES